MDAQREDCSLSAITGNILHLSERHTVAIFRRDGLCWVADFQDDCSELTDAASWFRAMPGVLRYSHSRRAAALETMTMMTPEFIEKIERLHRQAVLREASMGQAFAAVPAAVRRWSGDMASKIRSWSSRLTHRQVECFSGKNHGGGGQSSLNSVLRNTLTAVLAA